MKTATSSKKASVRKSSRIAKLVTNGNGHSGGEVPAPAITPGVAAWLRKPKLNLIDGKWVPAVSGRTFEVFNPANDSVIAHAAEGEQEDINRAVSAARRAFDSGPWRRLTASERARWFGG